LFDRFDASRRRARASQQSQAEAGPRWKEEDDGGALDKQKRIGG